MPTRLLSSSVLKWPDAETVHTKVIQWADQLAKMRDDIIRIGYFGSYATNNWGVGSDLDIIIIVKDSDKPFQKRSVDWDTTELPVSADVLTYTKEEWENLDKQSRFYKTLSTEVVWLY